MKTNFKIFLFVFAIAITAFVVLDSCKKNKAGVSTTGKEKALTLVASPANQVEGTVTIQENEDKTFNIVINLTKTAKDSMVYVDVHNGSFQDPFGKQAIDLGSIRCDGGSGSNITRNISHITLQDLSRAAISYDSILTYKAFINLSFSHTTHNVSTAIAHVDL
jgi:hypothetical protein